MARAADALNPSVAGVTRCECTHCGLWVPRGLIEPNRDEQFCCNACLTAYEAIKACGLAAYYDLRERLDAEGKPAKSTGGRYDELNAEVFERLHVRTDDETGLSQCDLYLDGVHCAACVWLVERTPQIVSGLVESRLDLGRSLVSVSWDPNSVELSKIARTIDSFGYRVHPPSRSSQRSARRDADRRALIRIGIAGAFAGNAMLLAIALYAGMFEGMDSQTRFAFRLISAALALLSTLWPGRVFFTGAMGAVRARMWHLDMPIAFALGTGLVAGLVNAVRDTGEVYFDSITMLVFLLLVGRWFQQRGQRAAADALELLFALTAASAHVIGEDGSVTDEPIESVVIGTNIEIYAGESIPVDGVIVQGCSSLDESVMTGESHPVHVSQGDRIAAGSVNISAPLCVLTEAVGDQTRLGRVMRDIERHARTQTPVIGHADRLAGVFVLVVMSLALATFVYWVPANFELALGHATSLLIVCCPCALALATPLVTAVAVGRAAKSGVLIKGAGAFENIVRPGVVLMDKTGTLTRGTFECIRWIGDEDLRTPVAALESGSTHPIARALSSSESTDLSSVSDVEHRVGLGVSGLIDERRYAVGSVAYMSDLGVEVDPLLAADAKQEAEAGNTPIFVACGGVAGAVAVLGDELRPESAGVVDRLKAGGWSVGIVSGDRQEVVDSVATELGIDSNLAFGGMSPEDKISVVLKQKEERSVVMIGDGVNDAAALAQASFGIALQGGAEASLAAAHAYVIGDDLDKLPQLLTGARRTVAAVKMCLAVSLGYNAIAASLAAAGLLTPLIAAFLMPISSLTVLAMALHAKTFADEQ